MPGATRKWIPAGYNTNYCLLFGLRISSSVWSEYGDQLKRVTPPAGGNPWPATGSAIDMFYRASLELASSRLVDADVRPCWWKERTALEAYALRLGPAHVFTCMSQAPLRAVVLTASRKALGLRPGKRTFTWNFDNRPPESIVHRPLPLPAGWDRLCSAITCRSALQADTPRVSVPMGDVPPQLVRLAMLTQVPGALVSAAGQDTQFVLPETLGCRVTGTAEEATHRVTLDIAADKSCAVIAWWPQSWGAADVELHRAQAVQQVTLSTGQYVTYGTERFIRLDLPAGNTTLQLLPAA